MKTWPCCCIAHGVDKPLKCCRDDTAYSESGDASRLSSEFSHENEEPNCCGRADDLNLVVKATSNLQVYRFKVLSLFSGIN